MNTIKTELIHVYFMRNYEKLFMGRLAWKERKIFFEYQTDFIKTGLSLSPFKLPVKPGLLTCEDRVFEGLFGVFNDSLPDGWGRLLLDRKLMSQGIHPGELSPVERLCYVGNSGMGALQYEPAIENIDVTHPKNIDDIANEVLQFQENDNDYFVDALLAMNGSSAGARPKILVNLDGEDWIIKFRSSLDPKDIGAIEYAYHLLAKNANLDVPQGKLFPSKKCAGYFGVQRFDRLHGKQLHMHTISGLLHADHRLPSLDYETIIRTTLWLTKDQRECEKQFRAAVFNVLTHNRDDHSKNFSFLMDANGTWRVSPAYDLTFSSGPGGEHCTMMMGEGKNPTLIHLLKLAEVANIEKSKALLIINDVKIAVSNWPSIARKAGVETSSLKRIQKTLETLRHKM